MDRMDCEKNGGENGNNLIVKEDVDEPIDAQSYKDVQNDVCEVISNYV